jgi:thioredoxin reductase (NADPH)
LLALAFNMAKQFDLDVAIAGAGPAGLAVANELRRAGYSAALFDKGALASAIADFPTFMRFFSTKDLLEIDRFPLNIAAEKPSRQEYLVYLHRFARDKGLDVRAQHEVKRVQKLPEEDGGGFALAIESAGKGPLEVRARWVVIATGAWDNPAMLGIPGEGLPKVSHRYREAFPYIGRKTLVVGGRNSAIEVALELWRAGADMDLSYRRFDFSGAGLKYWIVPDIENRLANNEIRGHLGTVPVQIGPGFVRLREVRGGREYEIENDFVLCMTGYRPDLGLLGESGVAFDPETSVPAHDPDTFESNVPGLFLAGVMLQGNISGKIFIENSRHHGERIVEGLRRREEPAPLRAETRRQESAAASA